MRFPGATAANGGGPLAALGTKARKKWLRSCVAGTWLDPANDDETDGCGSKKKTQKRALLAAKTNDRKERERTRASPGSKLGARSA